MAVLPLCNITEPCSNSWLCHSVRKSVITNLTFPSGGTKCFLWSLFLTVLYHGIRHYYRRENVQESKGNILLKPGYIWATESKSNILKPGYIWAADSKEKFQKALTGQVDDIQNRIKQLQSDVLDYTGDAGVIK